MVALFYSWVPDTVLDAWYATALDTEDILSGAMRDKLIFIVADVIATFDTVDRGTLGLCLRSVRFAQLVSEGLF